MPLTRLIGAAALLALASSATASSFVATTDALVSGVAATSEATSDLSSSLRDDKQVLEARDDAASFVASAGEIRGVRLEAALLHIRSRVPALATADDLQLAQAILSL